MSAAISNFTLARFSARRPSERFLVPLGPIWKGLWGNRKVEYVSRRYGARIEALTSSWVVGSVLKAAADQGVCIQPGGEEKMEQTQDTSIALRFRQDSRAGWSDAVPRTQLTNALNYLRKTVNLAAGINEVLADSGTAHTRLIAKNRFDFDVDFQVHDRYHVFNLVFSYKSNSDRTHSEDVVSAVMATNRLLVAFSRNDRDDFFKMVPDASFQRTIVDEFCKMFRRYEDGLGFEIADSDFNIIADISDVFRNAERLKESYEKPGTSSVVVGRIKSINLTNGRFSLLVAGSEDNAVNCTYSDDDRPMLLRDPQKLIEVQGVIELDLEGQPAKVRRVKAICPVDTSDIPVSDVLPDHLELREPEGPLFSVDYDEEGQCYTAILGETDTYVVDRK